MLAGGHSSYGGALNSSLLPRPSAFDPPCPPPSQDRWGEAARKLAEMLNDDTFRSLEGKSKHQLWLELCDMVTKHPREVSGMKVDAILRGGIRKFTDEVSDEGGEGGAVDMVSKQPHGVSGLNFPSHPSFPPSPL